MMADDSEVQNVENAAPAEDAGADEGEAKVAETGAEAKNEGGEEEPEVPTTDAANKEAAANGEVDTDAPRLNKNSLPIRAYLDQTVVPVLLQVRPST